MRLEGQVALVTGSATGIGRATALALAGEGAAVAVNYIDDVEAEAARTAADVEKLGRRAILVKADVSDEAQVKAMVDRVNAALGRLDILVNAAGTTKFIDFTDLDAVTDEIWDRIMDVNLKGTFYCSRAASKLMVAQGKGCIVNVASIAGLRPFGSSIPYGASKAGIMSLTRSFAVALAPHVRVNAVAPGFVDTRWHAPASAARKRAEANTKLGRLGGPEDIAEAIVSFVAGAAFVTGQVLVVDGGQYL